MFSRLLRSCLVVLAVAVPAFAGDEAPAWLQQAASIPIPAYDKDVPAVVLQNDQHVTVNEDGRVVTVSTFAIRILVHEGREFAHALEFYESDAGKIREMKAWLIRQGGQTKKYGKDEIVDAIEDANDVYNESRFKFIDASNDADTGSVFGYQTTTEQRSIFSQDVWSFQSRLPTLSSRYTLELPKGWSARGVTFNHDNVEPVVNNSIYTWELHNLAPITPEPSSPVVSSLAPRVAISYFPPGDKNSANFKTFANWSEVSYWLTQLHDPQSVADEALATKVRQLTANATTELDKIRAIGRFVQDIKYISIDIGVSRGGGMRPHAASEVFAKSYGDCKDKANLMRAMLKVIGITSYPVGIFSGDRNYVRQEWASPHQFNHCIIAIKVSDATQVATVLDVPNLGRLLIFDVTDDDTLVGDLPEDEQGSFALIVAGEAGSLNRMPVTPPEANLIDRRVNASLSADGSMTARVQEQAIGSWGAAFRSQFRHATRPDYLKMIERWVTAGAAGAKITGVDPRDDGVSGKFNLDVDFVAPGYAQLMQNRLLVFKPVMVSRRDSLVLTEAKRAHAVVLDSRLFNETVLVKLPVGFEVDELPDPVKLETAFGTYSTTYAVKDGELTFNRKLVLLAATIPVEQYASVRSFFEKIRAAEQSPVVLARK